MSIVSLFSASHCHGREVAEAVRDRLGYDLLSNERLLADASARFKVPEHKQDRAMHGAVSVFNRLTHERERNLAYVRTKCEGERIALTATRQLREMGVEV